MRKFLLNLTHVEPLALVKTLFCFENLLELYVLLVGAPCLGVHDPVHVACLIQSGLSSVGAKCSTTFEVSNKGGKYDRSNSTLNNGCKPRKGEILNSKAFSSTTFVMV